ncbi:hypothetical protein QE400_000608 [Xanthomonas sacchari]|uniref:DUF2971 domain-containing protein n=1 Tax=Xanthomonas sacchari TaxID=56458 RepID=UPI002784574B|nr:DUF2971 domain-containing protein [Xanthomonas sacchari]MDQ1091195.1 hypothetical protein [Xanthomonas sacchari]
MPGKIYKYFGPQVSDLVFSDVGAALKCSLPKNFNDPYELFLTVDFSSDPSALACYQELIGRIPQLPTTCFSVSPAVSPMWAHYGLNASGFVVEFDENELIDLFPESKFDDVRYQDKADDGLTEMLYRAHVIGKPRYTYFLQSGTFYAAYFTKATCWSYEMERRMVADMAEVRVSNDLLLLEVPKSCITSIIAGAKSCEDLKNSLKARADSFDCAFYNMQIGRTTITPYFLDGYGATCIFNGDEIVLAQCSCESCREPIPEGNEKCSWCQITDEHRYEAAIRNPYRMLDRIGHLDSYIKSMDGITERLNKGRKKS